MLNVWWPFDLWLRSRCGRTVTQKIREMTWNPQFLAMGSTDGCLRNHMKEPPWKVVISCLLHLAGPNEMHPKEQTLCDIVRTYKTADALVIIHFGKLPPSAPHHPGWPHSSFVHVTILTEHGQVYIASLSLGFLVCEMGMKILYHKCDVCFASGRLSWFCNLKGT